jgi:type IV pilus assembly protein PilV
MKNSYQKKHSSQSGFSLIEVLISALVITVGVLGMAGLQVGAKRAGYEAMQRTAASSLAQDMLERMRANPDKLTSYSSTALGDGSISSVPDPICSHSTLSPCTSVQLAVYDLWAWEQAIDGATELNSEDEAVGGLVTPTGCITVTGSAVTIAIAWQGYQDMSSPAGSTCGAGAGKYGDNDAKRQLVVLNTYIADI